MVKKFFVIFVFFPIAVFSQSTITVNYIKKSFKKEIVDTSLFHKEILINKKIDKVNGSVIKVDSTIMYFKDSSIVYILHKEIENSYDGPNYYQRIYEHYYIENSLVFYRRVSFVGSFGVNSVNAREDIHTYLNLKGECLEHYKPRVASGPSSTILKKLKKISLEEKSCMYSTISGNEGDKYIKKLKIKNSKYNYLPN